MSTTTTDPQRTTISRKGLLRGDRYFVKYTLYDDYDIDTVFIPRNTTNTVEDRITLQSSLNQPNSIIEKGWYLTDSMFISNKTLGIALFLILLFILIWYLINLYNKRKTMKA